MRTEADMPDERLTKLKQFLSNYSLLISAGAVSTAWYMVSIKELSLPALFYWLMGSTVWLIFTIDHLLDGLNRTTPDAPRHLLHRKYQKPLIALVAFLAGFNATLAILNFKEAFIQHGIWLFAFMCLYLLLVNNTHRNRRPLNSKEMLVAAGATLGMNILPLLSSAALFSIADLLLIVIFFLIHLSNILTFSRFDLQSDVRDQMTSWVAGMGFARSSRLIFNLIAVIYLLSIVWLFTAYGLHKIKTALILVIMINILALINLNYYRFKKHEDYRFWGDFIYLIPGILWWLVKL